MLEILTKNFSQLAKRLRGQARLTEDNIRGAADEIRAALLEADVALPVVNDFIDKVAADALGQEVAHSLTPGQAFLGIVHRRLIELVGGVNEPLRFKRAPAVILACGLQGVGKTTNLAKIAKYLKTKMKKRVLLASVDVYRPAAVEQLQILAGDSALPFFSDDSSAPVKRAESAVKQARQALTDVLLLDTAGRTTLDAEMMDEIENLKNALQPAEVLFFIDAMQGQDAVNTALAFHQRVGVTGLVMTKFDGDSRGGGALAAKAVTGQPIKFVGVGEKPDDLQLFHPERFVSRILGMGDIASLAEQIQDKVDTAELQRLDKKMRKKSADFDLNDLLQQLKQMEKMGGVASLVDKLPGALSEKFAAAGMDDGGKMMRMETIILSMTPDERRQPDIIKASRKRRIAGGASVPVPEVNAMLQHYGMMRKMIRKQAKNPAAMMRMMRQMMG